jgi:ABC-2 type transport system ATP-binding protein
MIEIRALQKSYGPIPVVDIPALAIGKGERFGLVGNNGAGKTTLFRMILDLIRPTAGAVLIDGQTVQGTDGWKHYVGSFLDEGFLISYLTPDEYFRFVGKLHGYSDADLQTFYARFEELFHGEIMGQKKHIGELSKGNLKKVGIAAAFIGNP